MSYRHGTVHIVLEVVVGERLDGLVRRLASVYAEPPEDPMAPDWIVVPSPALNRWMRIELSTVLGATGVERTDGVTANILRLGPHAFRQRLLFPDDPDNDPWRVDHLAWEVAEVLVDSVEDPTLSKVSSVPEGATLWARAHRIATMFDRYHTYRPEMVQAWANGDDLDGAGKEILDRLAWQPVLWRLLRERLGVPSPAQRLPEAVEALRNGNVPTDVPERVSVFGLCDLPGGSSFLDLILALATNRKVHLFLPISSTSLISVPRDALDHPLLRSWARESHDTVSLVDEFARNAGEVVHVDVIAADLPAAVAPAKPPHTLLTTVQDAIRGNCAPVGDWLPVAGDRSIRIHRCHGVSRQVEVLRDELLHLLKQSAADCDERLREDDIVVMCPDLDRFRPAIETLWGASAGGDATQWFGTPALSYHIAASAPGRDLPMFTSLATMVELAASRFSAAAVLDLAGQEAVRERFGFTDGDLETLANWVEKANTRWGIDGEHRQRWGLPADFENSTLMMLVDRLLIGVATSDDPELLGPGDLLPLEVEGDGIALAGRFAGLILRLKEFVEVISSARTIGEWVDLLEQLVEDTLSVGPDDSRQAGTLAAMFAAVEREAARPNSDSLLKIGFDDLKMVLGRHMGSQVGRGVFFRGGITVCPPGSLAGIPHKVVAFLGMDEGAFPVAAPDGDDLMAAEPKRGDPNRRDRARQALLDAVLSAESNLVITCNGHSVVTNQEVPRAVVLSEFEEVITGTLDLAGRDETLCGVVVDHPRQTYDPDNFIAGSLDRALQDPWSFDPVAMDGALRLDDGTGMNRGWQADPLAVAAPSVIEVTRLAAFLEAPVKVFVRDSLGVKMPQPADRGSGGAVTPVAGPSGLLPVAEGETLVTLLDYMEKWSFTDRLLNHCRAGSDVEAFVRREYAAQHLGPGAFFDSDFATANATVEMLLAALATCGDVHGLPNDRSVDVEVGSGCRIVGTVKVYENEYPGPLRVTPSSYAHFRRIPGWVELLLLTAMEPLTQWCSTTITKQARSNGRKAVTSQLWVRGEDPVEREAVARGALAVLVDLYARGTREPLPLFRNTSAAVAYKEKPTEIVQQWEGDYNSTRERDDVWNRQAFGGLSFDDLKAIEVETRDPDGAGSSRLERYAHHLWDTLEQSVTTEPPNGGE